MKLIIKTLAAAAVALSLAGAAALSGCTVSLGEDGRDGQDVSIYEIWEATKAETGDPDLTFAEFISQYLSYDSSELGQMTSMQAAINRSLLSSVQVTATFEISTGSNPFFPFLEETNQAVSAGSGVIIDIDREAGDMYVVTNAHVVFNNSSSEGNKFSSDVDIYLYGSEYSIYTQNGSSYIDDTNAIPARIIGASLSYDIAVLQVQDSATVRRSSAVAAEWCTDENVAVGLPVYAIGNAAADGISATNGIVCVDSEDIVLDMYDTEQYTADDFTYRTIRTSVPIYSGNSGGGLFNTDGMLVGIINSKSYVAGDGEYSDNISNALPAANMRRAAQNIIDRYESTGEPCYSLYRATLGVTVGSVSGKAYMNNQTNLVEIVERVEVQDISQGSVARGILKDGDCITAIKICSREGTVREEVSVTRLYNISEVLLSAREGDTVTLTVERASEQNALLCTLPITSGCMQSYI